MEDGYQHLRSVGNTAAATVNLALSHGGGKSVIFGDPHMPASHKERHSAAFARAIRDLVDYIPGPDTGTRRTLYGLGADEIGRRSACLQIGGIPLDEIGATGLGRHGDRAALPYCGLSLKGRTPSPFKASVRWTAMLHGLGLTKWPDPSPLQTPAPCCTT